MFGLFAGGWINNFSAGVQHFIVGLPGILLALVVHLLCVNATRHG